jgi:hypothetical protein
MLIHVIDAPREFDFAGTAAASTSVVELGTFDLAGARNFAVAARIHSATILTTGTIVVKAYPAWPWDGAPMIRYADGTAAASVSFDVAYHATGGAYKGDESLAEAPAVRLTVEGTQPSSAGGLKAMLTIGLMLFNS